MKRSHLIFYILLNILISAATTLAVLAAWDRFRGTEVPPPPQGLAGVETAAPDPGEGEEIVDFTPAPTQTLPPLDQPVIQILSVVGAGNLDSEVVMFKRLGEGNLTMTGWRLEGDRGSVYTFPEQPELVLFKDGAVQLYTRAGETTPTTVFWGRGEPAWHSGESIRLLDTEGNERAAYRVP